MITRVIKKFPDLNREESGELKPDFSYQLFIDEIIRDQKLWCAVRKVYETMIGKTSPFQKSIYADKTFCRYDLHEKLMFLAAEGMSYVLFAGRTASLNVTDYLDVHQKYRVKADEAYIKHCGCPSGYNYTLKSLSALIPSLPESDVHPITNRGDIFKYTRKFDHSEKQTRKAEMLMDYINYKPTEARILRITKFTENHIQLAIEITKKKWPNLLQHYNGKNSCTNSSGK